MQTNHLNLEFTRTVTRTGYNYTLTQDGKTLATRSSAKEFTHVTANTNGQGQLVYFNYCGRLDLAQRQVVSGGRVVALSATHGTATPKREAQPQLAFDAYQAIPLAPNQAEELAATAAVAADEAEYIAARNTRGAQAGAEAIAAYYAKRNAEAASGQPTAYDRLILARKGLALHMLVRIAGTYRGVVNPVFKVEYHYSQPGKPGGYRLRMMKAPSLGTNVLATLYALSRELYQGHQLVAPSEAARLDDTEVFVPGTRAKAGKAYVVTFRANHGELAAKSTADVTAPNTAAALALFRAERPQAVVLACRLAVAPDAEAQQYEPNEAQLIAPGAIMQVVRASGTATAAMPRPTFGKNLLAEMTKQAQAHDLAHAKTQVLELLEAYRLAPELENLHTRPQLGDTVVAVQRGHLIGGHVAGYERDADGTPAVLLCSGHWVVMDAWAGACRLGHNATARLWLVLDNMAQRWGRSMAAVKRARKARRKVRGTVAMYAWAERGRAQRPTIARLATLGVSHNADRPGVRTWLGLARTLRQTLQPTELAPWALCPWPLQ